MAIRPYFNKPIVELEAMAAHASRDLLKALDAELEHRTTLRAIKLRDQIREKLKGNEGPQPPLPGLGIPSPQPEKSHDSNQQSLFEGTPSFGPNPAGHAASNTSRQQTSHTNQTFQFAKKGVIRPPGSIPGVPSPRTFDLNKTLTLTVPKGASNPVVYEAALKELIKELKREGAAVRQILLRDGQSVHLDGQDFGYQFRYDDEADLFEGAAVTASVGGVLADGKIAAVMGNTLLLALSADFGPHIDTCLLKVDNTAMLEALRARLEKIGQGSAAGFNLKMADAVVANAGDEAQPVPVPSAAHGLNRLQQEAVARMLANEVYFLWGPPGTGKTETLSALAVVLMEQKKRLLVCSNTNQAVDQILLKLCKRFTAQNPLVSDGGIIRIGTISHNELQRDWADKITVDGIVERRSVELRNRRAVLQPKLDALNKAAERASEVVSLYTQLDKVQSEAKRQADLFQSAVNTYKRAEETKQGLVTRQQGLEKERAAVIGAGALRRLVMRSLEKIDDDLAKAARELARAESLLPPARDQRQHAQEQAAAAAEAADTLRRSLAPYSRSAAEKEFEEFDAKRRPILDELAEIEKQLNDIRKAVLDGARIIGATVTKAYLSSQMFSAFDVVVIDEASMVMLPALYHSAGMAKEKVIISGDSMQLAPIVQTNQQAIFDVIGKSVFESAKIGLRKKSQSKRVTMLEEQYRMENSICQLITSMYGNKLRTSKTSRERLPIPVPFNAILTIIDTSSVGPFVNRDVFKSRYNVMNALAIRNLCRHFAEKACLSSNRDIGVATPYAAQAKLLRQALAEFGDTLQAGTVHRYQGDEKTVMILDIPDSLGEQRAGYFLEGTTFEHPGSLLFNVGISRAKEHLIVCANLSYLDSKLPGTAFLRDILYQMQRRGSVLDVREVLALYPTINDLRKLGRPFDLSAEAERTGLFNDREFDQVILPDLEQAQHSIAIYSGFITPQRIAYYESTFRRKLGEGVRIRCVTRPPRKNGSIDPEDGKAALDALERMGCVVDTRGDIHEKAVLIDEKVIWFGSLNPLSYSNGTSELMARTESETMTFAFAALMALERGAKAEKMKGATTKGENPRCEECGARCAWMKGRYGPYWECENERCGWKQNQGATRRGTGQKQTAPPHGEDRTCKKCGKPMKLRSGRFGNFYGCTGYPGCDHHEKV